MKKSGLLIILFGMLTLTSCKNEGGEPQAHQHIYDGATLKWTWNKSSVGLVSSASIKCSGCGETFIKNASIKEEITTKASCLEPGEKTYTARVQFGNKDYFNSKKFDLDITGHSFSNAYTFDKNKHYLNCEYCDELILQEAHDFSEFVVDINPQLGLYGSKSRVCNVCGYKDVQVIDRLMPSISDVKDAIDAVPATNKITIFNYEDMEYAVEMYDYLNDESISSLGNSYVEKAEAIKDMVENKFGMAFKVSDQIETTKSHADLSSEYNNLYGNVLKLSGNGDGWTEFILDSSLPKDAYEVKFSVFVSQPTDMSLSLSNDCNNTYDFANSQFTTKTAVENKLTLAANTWSEFTVPASDFARARYFALYCTEEGTPYGVTNNQPGYITNFYVVKKGFYRKSTSELIGLINSLPETSLLNPYDYSKLDLISTNLDLYDADEKEAITNINKFNEYKLAWDNKYSLVYDPTVNGLPSGIGGSKGSSGNFSIGNDPTYGKVLEINASFDATVQESKYFQLYFYGFHERTFGTNDKLIFSVKTPFSTVSGTSQSVWIGKDATANKSSLIENTWVEVKGTGLELNSSGDISTNFVDSSISLQRYDMNSTFGSYSGTYLLTCIIAEKGN